MITTNRWRNAKKPEDLEKSEDGEPKAKRAKLSKPIGESVKNDLENEAVNAVLQGTLLSCIIKCLLTFNRV